MLYGYQNLRIFKSTGSNPQKLILVMTGVFLTPANYLWYVMLWNKDCTINHQKLQHRAKGELPLLPTKIALWYKFILNFKFILKMFLFETKPHETETQVRSKPSGACKCKQLLKWNRWHLCTYANGEEEIPITLMKAKPSGLRSWPLQFKRGCNCNVEKMETD